MAKELRSYQKQALDNVSEHFRNKTKRVLLCAPCGSGKSFMGANAAMRAARNGKRVLWVAHRSELIDQAAAELRATTGLEVGIFQGQRKQNPRAPIQVASIQTLIRREHIPPAEFLIGDEAHRMLASQWHALLETYSNAHFLYLTATPSRGDGKPMGDLADVIVPTVQPSELIDEGVLTPCEIIAPSEEISKGLAEDPTEAYLRWGNRRKAIFFCQTKEHARRTCERLSESGIPNGLVTDETPWAARKMIYSKVADGTIRALVNVMVATEGLDIPSLEVCVIARSMGNAAMFIQCLDEKTEILTSRGFVGMDDIRPDDTVAAMDPSSGKSSWEKVEEIFKRELGESEAMFSISNPHLDIRVTGGHRMIAKSRKFDGTWGEWFFEEAEDMSERRSKVMVPVSSPMEIEDCELKDHEIDFIGWFLTDGTKSVRGTQILITQADHQPQIKDLRECISRCGFSCSEYKRDTSRFDCFPTKNNQTVFSIPSGKRKVYRGVEIRGWWHLRDFLDKDIGSSFDKMSRDQFWRLLRAMNLGNGAKKRGVDYSPRTMTITIGRRSAANRIQELSVVRGFRCNIVKNKTSNSWTVHVSDDQQWSLLPGKDRGSPSFSECPSTPGEMVWCVKNRLGTLFVRRNGKVSIVGNCAGRVMRSSKGKESGLLIDLKGVVNTFGSPEADRQYHLDGDDPVTIEEKKNSRVTKCASCGSTRTGAICPVCQMAHSTERPLVPEIIPTSLEVKSSIERSDESSAFYIRTVFDLMNRNVARFSAEASQAFRREYGSSPPSTLIRMFLEFFKGNLPPEDRPAWWPKDVDLPGKYRVSSSTKKGQQAAAAE